MKRRIIIGLLLLAAMNMAAQVKLAPLFGDGMVLQRQCTVKIWGKAAPGTQVSVGLPWTKTASRASVAADSTWTATFATPEAGGPYELTITQGKHRKIIKNVLIGEVWLCSGQSNMEMPIKGYEGQPVDGSIDAVATAKESVPIRIFDSDFVDGKLCVQYSRRPKDEIYGRWKTNAPENVANCSATAYYFARYLQNVLEVPVGIIVTAMGGANIESWLPEEVLEKQFPNTDLGELKGNGPLKAVQHTPAVLYNARMHPLRDYKVRGFVWYQGERNIGNASEYCDMLSAFVGHLRSVFEGGEKLPFLYVEIAPYNYGKGNLGASLVRQQQAKALEIIPNSGMISTSDLGDRLIHPRNKPEFGRRLALLALTDVYGMKGLDSHAPMYKSPEVKDGAAHISLSHADNGLCPMWSQLEGFEVAGADGEWHAANASIRGAQAGLVVSSPEVPEPVNVRYNWGVVPKASVFTPMGLPLHPFTTEK